MSEQHRFHNGKSGAALAVQLNLRAKSSEVKQLRSDGAVVVNLKATAAKADAELTRLLCQVLQVSASQVDIISGAGESRLVSIVDLDAGSVQQRLQNNIK